MEALAEQLILALAGYFAIGAIIAILFLVLIVSRIDDAAKGASALFRPIIFLGCMMLWPIILIRVITGKKINTPIEENE